MQRCRECNSLVRQVTYACGDTTLSHAAVNKRNTWACFKPRETPLLVDELGEALKNVWDGRFTDGGGDCGCERRGYTVLLTPEQCEIIQAALARYKEVGDAERV